MFDIIKELYLTSFLACFVWLNSFFIYANNYMYKKNMIGRKEKNIKIIAAFTATIIMSAIPLVNVIGTIGILGRGRDDYIKKTLKK